MTKATATKVRTLVRTTQKYRPMVKLPSSSTFALSAAKYYPALMRLARQ